MLDHVSLKLRSGEIMSVAGVEGNGQSELASVLTGVTKPMQGEIHIFNNQIEKYEPAEFRKNHVVYIPEDRMEVGCAVGMTIKENMFADKVDRYLKGRIFLNGR